MGYFSENSILFLANLKINNDKIWFKEHEDDYRNYILEPLQDLVVDLSDIMLDIDDKIETNPAIGKTISRIYRDIRFSKDKSPFRTNMWITFKRPIKDWQDYPGFFFEITPDHYSFGMGFYAASIKTMDNFRNKLLLAPDSFRKVIAFLNESKSPFIVGGESYKKTLNTDIPADMQEWYQRKSFFVMQNHEITNHFYTDKLLDDLISGFKKQKALYKYMQQIKEG